MKNKQATRLQSLTIYVLIIGVIVSLSVSFIMTREANELEALQRESTDSQGQPHDDHPHEGQLEVSDT